jgi:hypothetical protein
MSTTTSIEIIQKDYSKFENFDSTIKGLFISSMVSVIIVVILTVIYIDFIYFKNSSESTDYNKLKNVLKYSIFIFIFITCALNIASLIILKKLDTDNDNIKKYYITNLVFAIISGLLFISIILSKVDYLIALFA